MKWAKISEAKIVYTSDKLTPAPPLVPSFDNGGMSTATFYTWKKKYVRGLAN